MHWARCWCKSENQAYKYSIYLQVVCFIQVTLIDYVKLVNLFFYFVYFNYDFYEVETRKDWRSGALTSILFTPRTTRSCPPEELHTGLGSRVQ